MTEQSNPMHGEDRKPQSGGSDSAPPEDYRIGPGHPPPDSRWKKGGPSPNPRGRPRKEQSMLPDARKALQQALNKKVAVSRGDQKVLMTRLDIGFEQLLNQFAKGDRYARRDLMEYADKLGIDFLANHRQAVAEALSPNHQAILEAALARRSAAATAMPAPPVLAPPELLDDDAAEPEPTLPSPPTAMTEPEAKAPPATQKLDQASYGPGRPPPGGFSVTTGKCT